jgi:hypothetical protein
LCVYLTGTDVAPNNLTVIHYHLPEASPQHSTNTAYKAGQRYALTYQAPAMPRASLDNVLQYINTVVDILLSVHGSQLPLISTVARLSSLLVETMDVGVLPH